jgi:putative transcriptional regulator
MNASVAERIKQRLEEFTQDLESGAALERKYTCRRVEFRLKPRPYSPEAVKRTRQLLCASQKIFALFLGASVKAVQAWEQGENRPPGMACRIMETDGCAFADLPRCPACGLVVGVRPWLPRTESRLKREGTRGQWTGRVFDSGRRPDPATILSSLLGSQRAGPVTRFPPGSVTYLLLNPAV